MVLETLAEAGIDCFDVASPAEFAAVRAVAPKAELLYTHPVKAQSDIRLALEDYRIRVLALDHEDEVAKILRIVRGLDLDSGGHHAVRPARLARARRLRAVEEVRRGAGACGRTGRAHLQYRLSRRRSASMSAARSRTPTPMSGRWRRPPGCGAAPACRSSRSTSAAASRPPTATIRAARRRDIPSTPTLIAEVVHEADEWGFADVPLIAEPGRVIVARCFSLIVRVLLRKGRRIYINDGIWASLSDSWTGQDHAAGAAPARSGAAQAERRSRTR